MILGGRELRSSSLSGSTNAEEHHRCEKFGVDCDCAGVWARGVSAVEMLVCHIMREDSLKVDEPTI